jgi:hypothetical protein
LFSWKNVPERVNVKNKPRGAWGGNNYAAAGGVDSEAIFVSTSFILASSASLVTGLKK